MQKRRQPRQRGQVGVGLGLQTDPGAGRSVKHPCRNLQPTLRFGRLQVAAENNAARSLNRLVNANSKT
jgi:hypothetical protein